ncbi:ribosome biogenesis GTPase Der [Candidatus Peribacteria bacterium]|nr:ribosome biogenesis GTPase Der [Candidatus Peribacteria bacterium]
MQPLHALPQVAIIGRPNVGKSTLFNALAGEKRSIVSEIAGTTRDRVVMKVEGEQHAYLLIDTAGLTNNDGDSLEQEIQTQAKLALSQADVLLFMVDGTKDPTSEDHLVADMVRKSGKDFLFLASKIDDGNEARVLQWTEMGFGMPHTVSGKNWYGVAAMEEELEQLLTQRGYPALRTTAPTPDETAPLRLCFLGRPNVGKSSLTNQLLGSHASIVSEVSGTTRDSIDTPYTDAEGHEYVLIDTAGLRKKGKVGRSLEYWSTVRTRQAIERSDVCIVMLDALDGVTHQDLTIIGEVVDAGKGLILGVNKFDLVYEKSRTEEESDDRELAEVKMWGEDLNDIKRRYLHYMGVKIGFARWAPVVFFSAHTGKGTQTLLLNARNVQAERRKRISTSELNQFLPEIYYGHVQPSYQNRQGKMKYMAQVSVSPPHFVIHVNTTKAFHRTYKRYIENALRKQYGFHGTPIKLTLRDNDSE